jgi:hypothetical protein
MVEKCKRDEPVLAIALMHRQGEEIKRDLRARLKEEGLLGVQDTQVTWLRDLSFSDAQRGDAVNYSAGQVAKFHKLAPGGFKPGQSWTVDRVEDGKVIVSYAGRENALPLDSATAFGVFESGVMPLTEGDMILATRNNPRANIKTGELCKVKAIDERYLTLEGASWTSPKACTCGRVTA